MRERCDKVVLVLVRLFREPARYNCLSGLSICRRARCPLARRTKHRSRLSTIEAHCLPACLAGSCVPERPLPVCRVAAGQAMQVAGRYVTALSIALAISSSTSSHFALVESSLLSRSVLCCQDKTVCSISSHPILNGSSNN